MERAEEVTDVKPAHYYYRLKRRKGAITGISARKVHRLPDDPDEMPPGIDGMGTEQFVNAIIEDHGFEHKQSLDGWVHSVLPELLGEL